jgi:hypothetical protein
MNELSIYKILPFFFFLTELGCSKPLWKVAACQAPVAHACNPGYSGGRDEDHSSKPAWANISQDPISKKPIIKIGHTGPEFKPQYCKKEKGCSITS